jgi:hypothetical protein
MNPTVGRGRAVRALERKTVEEPFPLEPPGGRRRLLRNLLLLSLIFFVPLSRKRVCEENE